MTIIAALAATMLSCGTLTVVDGDTIKCDGVTMRLIGRGEPFVSGIDTPETGSRAKCDRERMLGKEAKKRLTELLRAPGARVELSRQVDKTSQRRPLVRLHLGDGRLAEDILLQEGHAVVWTPGYKRPWCG